MNYDIKEFNWKQHIRDVHEDMADDIEYLFPNNSTETFLTAIWKMSMDVLGGMEVQVIVDDKDHLYISRGNPSDLSLGIRDHENDNLSIEFPIKSWVFTKPGGKAKLEVNDWSVINFWNFKIINCIVLGNNEYLAYDIKNDLGKKVFYGKLRKINNN